MIRTLLSSSTVGCLNDSINYRHPGSTDTTLSAMAGATILSTMSKVAQDYHIQEMYLDSLTRNELQVLEEKIEEQRQKEPSNEKVKILIIK